MLLSSGDTFPHLIQKRRSQLGFVTYLLNCPRTSTESNLVTAQNTDRELPEDGHTYGPKHVGATSLKYFNILLSVLNINVN
jgi:hypothetical protein